MNADISPHPNIYCYHFYDFDDRRKYNGIASSKCKTYVPSGISHAGFMLMTLLNTTNAAGTLLLYLSLRIMESLPLV
jgi:hypothetical protein